MLRKSCFKRDGHREGRSGGERPIGLGQAQVSRPGLEGQARDVPGANGDFEWSINYADGTGETQIGDYEVDEEDQEVELKSNDGEIFKLEAEVEGDKLELSGNLDGQRVVVKADRD